MPILGAHMSIAGGYYKAVQAAAACGCDCVVLFTKNNNQWRAKPLVERDVALFQAALARTGIRFPLSHDSYLINLASADPALWQRSVDSLVEELSRASRLGIPFVVTHPGAYVTGGEKAGLKRIVRALNEIHRRTPADGAQVLLENTAGQGSNLGWRLDQLGAILSGVRHPERLGVCIDTCHLFAAGYPLETAAQYEQTIAALDAAVGLARVRAIHLNDSQKPLGSRVDRHAHIGRGQMGLAPFRHLLNDPRLNDRPMYLETPKEDENGVEMDVVNLRRLRRLVKKA